MAAVPKIPIPLPVHEVENGLAFRTPVGAVEIPAGQNKLLGTVDTSHFDKIRLVTDERIGSTANIILRLTIMEGDELVAQLDTVLLTPHSQVTRVYDVPATKIGIFADSVGPAGSEAGIDVLIYGQY
jgi:type III secretion protein HrpB1